MPSKRQLQRTAVAVGLLALIALSGCAGLSDTDSSTPSATQTPTAASTTSPSTIESSPSTPSATPTPTASPTTPNTTLLDQFPAGLTDTGLSNVTQMIRAHQTTAIKTPGVVTHRTHTNASTISIAASVRVAAERNLTRVQYVAQGQRITRNGTQNTTTAITANETSVRQYTVTDGNVTLDNRRNRTELFNRGLRGLSTARGPLQGALNRGNFTVTNVSKVDNTTSVVLRADQYAGGQRYNAQNIVTYNATVRITASGLIRSATERIVTERNENKRQYNFRYKFKPQSVNLPQRPQVPASIRLKSGDDSDS